MRPRAFEEAIDGPSGEIILLLQLRSLISVLLLGFPFLHHLHNLFNGLKFRDYLCFLGFLTFYWSGAPRRASLFGGFLLDFFGFFLFPWLRDARILERP